MPSADVDVIKAPSKSPIVSEHWANKGLEWLLEVLQPLQPFYKLQ